MTGRPSGSRRGKNDPAGVRARILSAAYDCFQSQGYNGTSINDLTRAAGVTSGALHHHFPTKKSIGLAVITDVVAEAVTETWLEPVKSAKSAREAILGVFENLACELDRQGFVKGCPVNNLALELAYSEPDFRAALRELFDDWRRTISDRMEGPDAEGRAATVVAAYSGAMAMAKVEQRGEPLRLCAQHISKLL